MEIKLFCDLHDKEKTFEVFQWLDENDQKAIECVICSAEEILRDYSEVHYPI